MLSQIKVRRHRFGVRNGLIGPGIEGDYFECRDEGILVQKLNALRVCKQVVIPPLLPRNQSSKSTLDVDDDEDPNRIFFDQLNEDSNLNLHHDDCNQKPNSKHQHEQKQKHSNEPLQKCTDPELTSAVVAKQSHKTPKIEPVAPTPAPTRSRKVTDKSWEGKEIIVMIEPVHESSSSSSSSSRTPSPTVSSRSPTSVRQFSDGTMSSRKITKTRSSITPKTTSTATTVKRQTSQSKTYAFNRISDNENHRIHHKRTKDAGVDVISNQQQQQQQQAQQKSEEGDHSTHEHIMMKQPLQETLTLHLHRSPSFSSSVHENEAEHTKEQYEAIHKQQEIDLSSAFTNVLKKNHETLTLKRSSSFSSSIHDHENENDDNVNMNMIMNDDKEDNLHSNLKKKVKKVKRLPRPLPSAESNYDDHLQKQEYHVWLENEDNLHDFKRINNFTSEGDYLLSRMLRERTRIQMKKELLQSEKELYVNVHRQVKGNDSQKERKVLFLC